MDPNENQDNTTMAVVMLSLQGWVWLKCTNVFVEVLCVLTAVSPTASLEISYRESRSTKSWEISRRSLVWIRKSWRVWSNKPEELPDNCRVTPFYNSQYLTAFTYDTVFIYHILSSGSQPFLFMPPHRLWYCFTCMFFCNNGNCFINILFNLVTLPNGVLFFKHKSNKNSLYQHCFFLFDIALAKESECLWTKTKLNLKHIWQMAVRLASDPHHCHTPSPEYSQLYLIFIPVSPKCWSDFSRLTSFLYRRNCQLIASAWSAPLYPPECVNLLLCGSVSDFLIPDSIIVSFSLSWNECVSSFSLVRSACLWVGVSDI